MATRKLKPTIHRIQATTDEEKIYVLEYALKLAVQTGSMNEKNLKAAYSRECSSNWELRKKVELLEKQIKDLTSF